MSDVKKGIKEEGLQISEIRELESEDPFLATFDVFLERPYVSQGKKNGEIAAGFYVNLLTNNSISFTKGLVLKKHLIAKHKQVESGSRSQNTADREID